MHILVKTNLWREAYAARASAACRPIKPRLRARLLEYRVSSFHCHAKTRPSNRLRSRHAAASFRLRATRNHIHRCPLRFKQLGLKFGQTPMISPACHGRSHGSPNRAASPLGSRQSRQTRPPDNDNCPQHASRAPCLILFSGTASKAAFSVLSTDKVRRHPAHRAVPLLRLACFTWSVNH